MSPQFTRHYVYFKSERIESAIAYSRPVPRLWDETIEAHRRAVREATLETTAALVARRGLRSVTMSEIAEETGIGRATLYKYFPDVEAILAAWHERQIGDHLDRLAQARDQVEGAGERLEAVLEAFALIARDSRGHGDNELAAVLHRHDAVVRAQQQVRDMLRDLVIEGVEAGVVRDDVPPEQLASYCLHALTAASILPSEAAVHRLVSVTMAGLRRPEGAR